MITNFKIFEKNKNNPKVGDYIIIRYKGEIIPEIGIILTSLNHKYKPFEYVVIFNNNFNFYEYGFTENELAFRKDEIEYWSKNKKDCELYFTLNKYNL